jgi:capsular exopolysaccharide synthesis family protein
MAATSASSSDGLRRFTRQWLLILTFAVLGVAAAVGFAALQHKRYTATASLSFNDSSQDVSILGSVPTENLQPTEQVNAAAETIKRTQVLTRVQRQLRGALSLSQLRGDVQATTNPESDLVQVTATTGGAALSAQAANAVANQAVAVTNGQTRAQYASAAHKLRAQLAGLGHGPGSAAARAELADAIGRLESLSLLATPGQIAEPARIPTSPSSPMPVLDGLIGGVVGMLIGLFAAMLRDSVDTRLRSSAQIKQVADLPVLGRVRGDSLGHVAGAGADDGQALGLESFRILRTNLEFLARDAPVKTILVTSAVAEEGKTTVASSLAYASAMVGKSTLLVDCDLRHPTVASRLGIEGRPGFTDCLTGRADRADVVRPVAVAGSENGAYAGLQIQPLYCIAAGTPHAHPAELLSSKRLISFLEEVSDAYDTVIIDSAPLLPVADTLELLPNVDCVLLCARASVSTRNQLTAVRETLSQFPDTLTRLVITGVTEEAEYGQYYYNGNAKPRRGLRRRQRV